MATTRTFNESWLMLLAVISILMVVPTCGVLQLQNSTLACTRGSNQTDHKLNCKTANAVGVVGAMFVSKIFCGALPNTSGCNRTAPYANCCVRSPDECVFQCDNRMEETVKKVTGYLEVTFSGTRESTSGKCVADVNANLTSFSFIEYGCVPSGLLANIWSDSSQEQQGEVYLETNFNFNNSNVRDSETECIVQTECNSNLTFFALYLRLKTANYTPCPEELSFADYKYPNLSSTVKCDNSSLIYNKELFTSTSNSAVIRMNVTGNHTGKIFIRAHASNQIANVKIACGADGKEAMKNILICPNDPYIGSSTNSVIDTVATSSVTSTAATSSVTSTAATSSVIDTVATNSVIDTVTTSSVIDTVATSSVIDTVATNSVTSTAATSSVAYITNTQGGSQVDGGTIAGIVLAVIAIILVSLLIIGIIVYRCRKNKPKQLPEPTYIEPSMKGPYEGMRDIDLDSGLDDNYDKLSSVKSSLNEEANSVGSYDVLSLARTQDSDYASIMGASGRGVPGHTNHPHGGIDNLAFHNDLYVQ